MQAPQQARSNPIDFPDVAVRTPKSSQKQLRALNLRKHSFSFERDYSINNEVSSPLSTWLINVALSQ